MDYFEVDDKIQKKQKKFHKRSKTNKKKELICQKKKIQKLYVRKLLKNKTSIKTKTKNNIPSKLILSFKTVL